MISKFIQVAAVGCALALAGTAVANNNGGSQQGSQQQGSQQQPTPQQQGQQQQQQGQMQQPQPMQQQQQAQQTPAQNTQNTNLKSVNLVSLDKDQIKAVQTRLKDVGFYRGQVDGVLGTNTRGALVSYFQSQASLVQQGRISDQALSGFGFSTNDIEKVRGVDSGNSGNVNNQRQNTNGQQ